MKFPIRLCIQNQISIQRLHLFSVDTDSVVAFDPEDAKKAIAELMDDIYDDDYDSLDQVPDSKIVVIHTESVDFDDFKKHRPPFSKVNSGGDYPSVEAPAWLWCLWNGRGLLCSSE